MPRIAAIFFSIELFVIVPSPPRRFRQILLPTAQQQQQGESMVNIFASWN
jgi:hypothetical protein